jgi:hypothetical protein
MKKMIAAFDGLKFSTSTLQYAIHLAKDHNAHLVGIFLEDISYHSYKIYELVSSEGVSVHQLKKLEEQDALARAKAVETFEAHCAKAGLNYSVHRDKKIALPSLLKESIFADLLIIDANETFTHYEEIRPSAFIKSLLEDVHCPVLLVPSKYKPVDTLVFLYDGSPASMQAVRTFGYLFPAMKITDMKVLTVKSLLDTLHVPDNRLLKEWMKRHFMRTAYIVLKGDLKKEIDAFVKTEPGNPLFITGAYRRSSLSMLFRRSIADFLLRDIKTPVFIAHS